MIASHSPSTNFCKIMDQSLKQSKLITPVNQALNATACSTPLTPAEYLPPVAHQYRASAGLWREGQGCSRQPEPCWGRGCPSASEGLESAPFLAHRSASPLKEMTEAAYTIQIYYKHHSIQWHPSLKSTFTIWPKCYQNTGNPLPRVQLNGSMKEKVLFVF